MWLSFPAHCAQYCDQSGLLQEGLRQVGGWDCDEVGAASAAGTGPSCYPPAGGADAGSACQLVVKSQCCL